MYSFNSRVRYSEVDSDEKITMQAIIDYFQDCSTFHSEDVNVGVKYLKQHNVAWVLNSWQIVVSKYPEFGDKIEIGTFPYDFKRFLGYRNFIMKSEDGTKSVVANSVWTLMNLNQMLPARSAEDMVKGYTIEERLKMEYAPRKIAINEEGKSEAPIIVKKHHLDTNNHVNNGQYVRMAMDFIPYDFEVSQMRAEYKKSALLGDIILPKVYKENDIYTIGLWDETDNLYASVELK